MSQRDNSRGNDARGNNQKGFKNAVERRASRKPSASRKRGGAQHYGRKPTSEELVNELFTLHLDTLLQTARGSK